MGGGQDLILFKVSPCHMHGIFRTHTCFNPLGLWYTLGV
jgi:hypothetical protein